MAVPLKIPDPDVSPLHDGDDKKDDDNYPGGPGLS